MRAGVLRHGHQHPRGRHPGPADVQHRLPQHGGRGGGAPGDVGALRPGRRQLQRLHPAAGHPWLHRPAGQLHLCGYAAPRRLGAQRCSLASHALLRSGAPEHAESCVPAKACAEPCRPADGVSLAVGGSELNFTFGGDMVSVPIQAFMAAAAPALAPHAGAHCSDWRPQPPAGVVGTPGRGLQQHAGPAPVGHPGWQTPAELWCALCGALGLSSSSSSCMRPAILKHTGQTALPGSHLAILDCLRSPLRHSAERGGSTGAGGRACPPTCCGPPQRSRGGGGAGSWRR